MFSRNIFKNRISSQAPVPCRHATRKVRLTNSTPDSGGGLPEGAKGVGGDALERGELGELGEDPAEL
jgi:hypothetical protein